LKYLGAIVSGHLIGEGRDMKDFKLFYDDHRRDCSPLEFYIQRICEPLWSTPSWKVNFPNLAEIQIWISLESPRDLADKVQVSVIKGHILSMLEHRSLCGAIGLRLKDSFYIQVEEINLPDYVNHSCHFELVESSPSAWEEEFGDI